MSLDLRDLSKQKQDSVFDIIRRKADSLAGATGTAIRFIPVHASIPAVTDKGIQDMIAGSARELGLSSMYLPSGAGHDTQDMARLPSPRVLFVLIHNRRRHS